MITNQYLFSIKYNEGRILYKLVGITGYTLNKLERMAHCPGNLQITCWQELLQFINAYITFLIIKQVKYQYSKYHNASYTE